MNTKPRVLIVEDEPTIAELLRINLSHHGFEPVWATDSGSAQHEIDQMLPDVILLDWMLPGESGLSLARRWRGHPRTHEVPIIMLTARGNEDERVAGLDAGADDYIVKPFSIEEMLARIRAVLRRRAPQHDHAILQAGLLQLDPATHQVQHDGVSLHLGPTEFRLLHHLMLHPERVHRRSQLLDQVWGDHVFIEERTVDVHIKRLRAALGPAGALIETVRGAGYRLTTRPPAPPPATTD